MEREQKPWIRSVPVLIGSIILCNLAGFFGSLVTVTGSGSWYDGLIKPDLTPPSWIFGPVWITLYVLMGISLYLVLMERQRGTDVRVPLILFGSQLIMNTLWSFLFFGLESPAAGLAGILLLWVLILATLLSFFRINRSASYLLIPYLAWVSLASYLNYAIFALNP